MFAAYIEELGGPDRIRYGELGPPQPGPTDVLVAVAATAVDRVDLFVRSGLYETAVPFPFVVGRDLVGRVVRAGEGVSGLREGDRVWCNSLGHGGRQGAAAQLAVVPADRLYRLPAGTDVTTAVALLHPVATAWLALFRHGGLTAGQTVLVGGAAGHVGSAAVVLAAKAGARVIGTARREDFGYCRSLGAHEVVDYRDPALTRRLRETAGDGVDVHLDTSGHNDLEQAVELLARRGRVVLMAGAGGASPRLPAGRLYMRDGSVRGFALSGASVAELADAARIVGQVLAGGWLRPRAMRVLPLSAAAEAHALLEDGRAGRERLVLVPPAS
jgi:NADPH:quinone reductase-like Zn-dependent oxidoreductase